MMFMQLFINVIFLASLSHGTSSRQYISCSDNKGLISITARSRNQETDSTGNCEIEVARKCWFLERKNQRNPISNFFCVFDRGYVCNKSIECDDVDPCSLGCHGYHKCRNGDCVSNLTECKNIYEEDLCDDIEQETPSFSSSNLRPRRTSESSRCFQCFDKSKLVPRDRVCDGIIDCSDLSDECLCDGDVPSICNDVIQASSFDDPKNPSSCAVGQVECGEGICVNRSAVCDGTKNCPDNRDESSAFCSSFFRVTYKLNPSNGNPNNNTTDHHSFLDQQSCAQSIFEAYTCNSVYGEEIFINYRRKCDMHCDCKNCEDELGCMDERFYCESGKPLFVAGTKRFNSKRDCSDWSDECLREPNQNITNDNIFSDQDLIRFPILRVLIWIMAVSAVAGNGIVICLEIKKLRSLLGSTLHGPLCANHLLILNLAVADLLMGIYLVMLGSIDHIYRGRFCQNQFSWCSGTTCQIMGTLVVLSSETSVITIVLLTTFRLLSVAEPIASRGRPKIWTIISLIALSWLISVALSLVPLLPSLQNIFAIQAYMPETLFFKTDAVSFEKAKTWALKALTYDSRSGINGFAQQVHQIKSTTSWNGIKEGLITTAISNYLTTTGLFGYYSAHSVCVPRLFATREQKSWKYSFTLMIVNLVAFVYVAVAYIVIVVRAKKGAIRIKTKTSPNKTRERSKSAIRGMQQKIFRLIFTNFCCWVPISVMAIISFAGITIPDMAYVISAIVLLPINSSLNPIIYSDLTGKMIKKLSSYQLLPSQNSSTTNLSKLGKPTSLPGTPEMKPKA